MSLTLFSSILLKNTTRLFSKNKSIITRSIMSNKNYTILNQDFQKPDLDDRSYRFIELPNKLKALLISDPTTDKAAASLDVNIGAFEDPESLPGLAHFCEHLLFMGSEKFPDENDYSSFLSKHGGHSNAYTGSQNTNYFFEINYEHLKGALDRFSGFFSCPLFNIGSTDKEINAVDSENKKNLQSDMWRIYQLDKSLSLLDHPYHKFSTGNLETLKIIPESKNVNVRDELLKFYNANYSANLMKLCIIGREDLDTLSDYVQSFFKDVKNIDKELPFYDSKILNDDQLTKIVSVEPVKELRKLEVSFVVPDYETHWESKIPHILSHLIGHEGNGSLLSHLKTLGWANELSAGGHTVSRGNAFFSIDIDLTENGLKNYEQVILLAFQYIEMLKNSLPQKWIYLELQNIANANFKFKQKGNPSSTVSSLSKLLEKEYIPVGNILSTGLFNKYEPELVEKYLSEMIYSNSRITLISKNLETDSKEKWYGTKYKLEDYSVDLINKIKTPGLNPNFHLPRPNEFIADNFHVDKPKNESDIIPLEEPLLLKDTSMGKLWYKKDDRFWQPRGYIKISFKLPHTHSTLLNSMLTTLYVQMVNDSLKDLQYDASCANLHVSLSKTNQGLDISLSGFNDKLIILLTRFLQGIKDFKPTSERFQIFKDKTIQHLKNSMYEVPYSQMSSLYNALINEKTWLPEEKLNMMNKLTLDQLNSFIPFIFDELFFECFVHGNLKYDEAIEIESLIDLLMSSKENLTNSQYENEKLRSYLLPKNKTYRYETLLKDRKNVNSCIQHVIQVDIYSEELSAICGLFAQMLHEPCFDTLRTKEQLGYVVFSSTLNNHGTANIRILVQSEKSTPYLEWRIDEFYKKFGDLLNGMSDEDFTKHKDALCKSLTQKFKNMNEESIRYSSAIYLGDYNFMHRVKKAKLVEELTKQQIIEFYEKYIMNEDSSRLIVHLKSHLTKDNKIDAEKLYPSGELIENIGSFKSKLLVAPLRQPVKKFEIYKPSI
ncbi:metalloendopeptidase NDAI_0J02240 [Naumovozyma dairenensis CBS 421]|uniref:Peptidase M16 N-terminal domain-containing protein n=1 Tax=Naumovozyma dairenensis (strain ATCC 10597 / BCRC 20456 / CBS 421 / NBRC 0211 / NRRL Y-12639) TaxID=1071378 RepID=G0WH38_NAUDC|nr:hypothetical protein NDAI_0J02240 [Naumovozyma dairenensis CBS 421]CCD27116.1 hypothetical protein NDAI_0J02240 [Naumovozyma dairenensis CBS 421]